MRRNTFMDMNMTMMCGMCTMCCTFGMHESRNAFER